MTNPETPFPPASHVPGEPTDWVIGVIDDRAEAERAVQDARDAGFPEEELLSFYAEQALDQAKTRAQAQNPLTRLFATVARYVTDPGTAEKEYIEEARAGHSIVNIRARSPERVALAHNILERRHAHRIKHFGQWTITDLKQ